MKLRIKRFFPGPNYTVGRMFVDTALFCDTLEDTVRPIKIKNETAIPAGTYKVILTMSQRFKKVLPLLVDVPGFEGIRIHPGNTKEDTSGCILVGENKEVGKLLNSKATFEKLMKLLTKADNIEITIT